MHEVKWWPSECKKGDMIRVRIGSIYHYGIFISEDEIIQFGLPPTALIPENEQRVCVSSIDEFACGSIVETAILDRNDQKRRYDADKTVRIARSRIGEGGYSLIHNNCEHFAYECVFGIKYCSQENAARRKWSNRSILDVYISSIVTCPDKPELYPPERSAEIATVTNSRLRSQMYTAWKLLELAFSHSFHKPITELAFQKTESGKWLCDAYWFSVSHTDTAAAVCVSNSEVGIDVEDVDAFRRKHTEVPESLKNRVLTEEERAVYPDPDIDSFAKLWTKKESIFKRCGNGVFVPSKIDTTKDTAASFLLRQEHGLIFSVSGANISSMRCFRADEGHFKLLFPQNIDRK